ncbi:AraC-like ligand binding domain-containing protein [Paenibacillus algorifonticola]|uniref:AraC-like ligand binding domain-containing protein n=1 Tax=Paenibacillus algorifonticola TaxID=684063 RepID=A0A1I2FIA1_9BACL|nr:AraC family transcriptional regulator [Paenibacillus algorifonticola]SFF04350.1 AraC-like ligand binding domain-containing protein [Paenibacillus algorifonticola]
MLTVNMDILPKIRLAGFVSYRTPWIHFKRKLDEYVLIFIKSGELHLLENGTPYILKRGDVFLLEPGLHHEGFEKHVCAYYYVHFSHANITSRPVGDRKALARHFLLEEKQADADDSNLCYLSKHFTLTGKSALLQAFHAMDELRELYCRKQYNQNLTALQFSRLLIELSREHLLAELHKENNLNSKSFMKVHALLEYIHHHYVDKIASPDIERLFECNFDYLNRIFKTITGYPIAQYIIKVRIDHAKELLQATSLSIGEIGYLSGLNDPYYFSKVFKKHIGLSPLQYRAEEAIST